MLKERLALRRAPNSPTLLTFIGTSSLPLMKAWLYISQRSYSAESVGVSSFTGEAMIWLKSSQEMDEAGSFRHAGEVGQKN